MKSKVKVSLDTVCRLLSSGQHMYEVEDGIPVQARATSGVVDEERNIITLTIEHREPVPEVATLVLLDRPPCPECQAREGEHG